MWTVHRRPAASCSLRARFHDSPDTISDTQDDKPLPGNDGVGKACAILLCGCVDAGAQGREGRVEARAAEDDRR